MRKDVTTEVIHRVAEYYGVTVKDIGKDMIKKGYAFDFAVTFFDGQKDWVFNERSPDGWLSPQI